MKTSRFIVELTYEDDILLDDEDDNELDFWLSLNEQENGEKLLLHSNLLGYEVADVRIIGFYND